MSKLRLTNHALADIDEIDRYSVERWGRGVADQYLANLSSALDRLQADLSLFSSRHDYTGRLRFYRVREHVFIADVIGGTGYLLSVWHGQMDFIDRLPRLEPALVYEAELLAQQIEKKKERRK